MRAVQLHRYHHQKLIEYFELVDAVINPTWLGLFRHNPGQSAARWGIRWGMQFSLMQ